MTSVLDRYRATRMVGLDAQPERARTDCAIRHLDT
jgi:hypothetical protein